MIHLDMCTILMPTLKLDKDSDKIDNYRPINNLAALDETLKQY